MVYFKSQNQLIIISTLWFFCRDMFFNRQYQIYEPQCDTSQSHTCSNWQSNNADLLSGFPFRLLLWHLALNSPPKMSRVTWPQHVRGVSILATMLVFMNFSSHLEKGHIQKPLKSHLVRQIRVLWDNIKYLKRVTMLFASNFV